MVAAPPSKQSRSPWLDETTSHDTEGLFVRTIPAQGRTSGGNTAAKCVRSHSRDLATRELDAGVLATHVIQPDHDASSRPERVDVRGVGMIEPRLGWMRNSNVAPAALYCTL